jgi:hypothetical protein
MTCADKEVKDLFGDKYLELLFLTEIYEFELYFKTSENFKYNFYLSKYRFAKKR